LEGHKDDVRWQFYVPLCRVVIKKNGNEENHMKNREERLSLHVEQLACKSQTTE
jgi:hypothetical protein